jgi:hypothetical protein
MTCLVTYGIPRIISNNHIIPNFAIPERRESEQET